MQEARVEELEAQLLNTQADLKSSQKRIDQLHGALKDHEEFSGDDEGDQYSRGDSLDNLSSEGSSYDINDSMDISDEDDDDDIVVPKSSRSLERNKLHSKDLSLSPDGEARRRKTSFKGEEEEDEFEASRKARQRRLKQLEEEDEAARKARQERLKNLGDGDLAASRKARQERLDIDDKKENEATTSSVTHGKKVYDDDEDDDDLEEFLLKQRERMKNLEKDSDDEEEEREKNSTLKATRGITSEVSSEELTSSSIRGHHRATHEERDTHVTNGNGVHSAKKSESREQSEEPHGSRRDSVEDRDSNATSRYRNRRKRQRRRTIEQLTSPEHNAAKSNGVNS